MVNLREDARVSSNGRLKKEKKEKKEKKNKVLNCMKLEYYKKSTQFQ